MAHQVPTKAFQQLITAIAMCASVHLSYGTGSASAEPIFQRTVTS